MQIMFKEMIQDLLQNIFVVAVILGLIVFILTITIGLGYELAIIIKQQLLQIFIGG